jgi:hypothetical protein
MSCLIQNNPQGIRLFFAYNSSMRLSAPQPRKHKVLMSFRYWNIWDVIFFDTDRMRTAMPRRARFTADEALIEFTHRAGGPKTLEDRNILDMMIRKKSGEITLELTDERYAKLRKA